MLKKLGGCGNIHYYNLRGMKICELINLLFNLQAPCFLYIGQAFRYSPENAFYIFNQQIYFII